MTPLPEAHRLAQTAVSRRLGRRRRPGPTVTPSAWCRSHTEPKRARRIGRMGPTGSQREGNRGGNCRKAGLFRSTARTRGGDATADSVDVDETPSNSGKTEVVSTSTLSTLRDQTCSTAANQKVVCNRLESGRAMGRTCEPVQPGPARLLPRQATQSLPAIRSRENAC